MGYFSGGKFHLSVSFRYDPVPGELGFWGQLMEQVSRLLYDATDGQHSIGQVLLSPNSMGGPDADIWVHPDGSVSTNSTDARLWFPNSALDISQDATSVAWILAHELCHYLYDLGDEYDHGSKCVGSIATQASMMESYAVDHCTRWKPASDIWYRTWAAFFPDFQAGAAILHQGQLSEFCHSGNHDTTQDNDQNYYNRKQSCWTYITDPANATPDRNPLTHLYGLVAPGVAGPILPAPAPPLPVTCTNLIPVQRFMLVFDRSGSMAGAKLDQLKVGANFWVDYVNAGEELGLVSYSGTPDLDSKMNPVPATNPAANSWRSARHTIVDNLVAGGMTAIGDALRVGLTDIVANGRASNQVMILFTDGLQNAGAETVEEVLPDLIASGVRCYTIGLGTTQDATILANVATTTGARYFAIDGDLDPDEAAAAITESLIEIAGESRENGGIVSFADVDGATVPAVLPPTVAPTAVPPTTYYDDQPPFLWPPEGSENKKEVSLQPLESFRFPVEITDGSRHCTLGILWKHTDQRFRIRVYDPDGNTLSPQPGVRLIQNGTYPYAFYEIDKPKDGIWQVEVLGDGIREARFRTIGFEVNDRIRFEVSPLETHIKSGSEIRIRIRLLVPHTVPGTKFTVWVRNPEGRWRRFPSTGPPSGLVAHERLVHTVSVPSETRRRGQYLIAVDAHCAKRTFEFKLDELYRIMPGLLPEDLTRTVVVPRIRRRVFLTVTADSEGRSAEEPLAGHNSKSPSIPRNQQMLLERWREAHPR